MAKGEIKSAFYECLAPRLAEQGFNRLKSSDAFTKVDGERTFKFLLIWLNVKQGYFVCPDASIRFEGVESIFHKTSGFESKYQRGTATVGASLGAILGGTQDDCAFPIKNQAEIELAAELAAEAFNKFAMPYYNKWSTLGAIDAGLNDDPNAKVGYLRAMPWFRCSTGIIVAKLVGRKNYADLVSRYTNVMTTNNDGFYLSRFNSLVDLLNSTL